MIYNICQEENVEYEYTKTIRHRYPSRNHGASLNWAIKKIVQYSGEQYFGFVDQDCFPLYNCSIVDHFSNNQPFFGKYQERVAYKMWYVWSGFCFFNKDSWNLRTMDLMPKYGGDSGAGLWPFYQKMGYTNESFCSLSESFMEEIDSRKNEFQILDGTWIHTTAASNWYGYDQELFLKKQHLIQELLSIYLSDDLKSYPKTPPVSASIFFRRKPQKNEA